MKRQLRHKSKWQFLLSALVAGLFILLALGSDLNQMWNEIAPDEEYQDDGSWKSTEFFGKSRQITQGERDDKKRWHGNVTIGWYRDRDGLTSEEEVEMVHGLRNGWSTNTFYSSFNNQTYVTTRFYIMGVEIKKEKAKKKAADNVTPQEILYNKHFWYHLKLQNLEFDSLYIDTFLDTLMTMLNSYEFAIEDFDEYLGDVMEELEETPWDSILTYNSRASMYMGLEQIKNDEFRMAVIDRIRTGAESTYEVILSDYANYLGLLKGFEVSAEDFEIFSHNIDSIMATFSTLEPEDPFFTDSVDRRIYRAISIIGESDESDKKAAKTINEINSLKDVYAYIRTQDPLPRRYSGQSIKMDPPEVGDVVVSLVLLEFSKANILRNCIHEAYLKNKGEEYLPQLATEYKGSPDETGATIRGYVVDKGSGEVSSWGIVWAGHYNPNLDDHIELSTSGTEDFTVSLNGLTPGESYYARTFATNEAGTAYGNNVEFIAQSTVGVLPSVGKEKNLQIYPNPASSLAMIKFYLDAPSKVSVLIYDLKGSLMDSPFHGQLPAGANTLELEVSGLTTGIYQCQVILGNSDKISKKLIISN